CHRRHHGAARLYRRLQRRRRPLHPPHDTAARSCLPPGPRALRAESAGEQAARDRRRHRRQLGMKSAVYNEVALVLLAAKLTGRPVKWIGTRSESFLGDAQARDNVTDAELAVDRDGTFLGMGVRSLVNVGAYLQTGMPAFTGNLGTLA